MIPGIVATTPAPPAAVLDINNIEVVYNKAVQVLRLSLIHI